MLWAEATHADLPTGDEEEVWNECFEFSPNLLDEQAIRLTGDFKGLLTPYVKESLAQSGNAKP